MSVVADVWIVLLPSAEICRRSAWSLLSPDECARAERFHRPLDRARYVYSHAALRLLLSDRLGCPNDALSFTRLPGGKPRLEPASVEFNLSRSGERAVIGVCDGSPIGVDTEAILPGIDYAAIANREFSRAEAEWMTSGSEPERLWRFYRLWTVREALAKATGSGLAIPASGLELTIADHGPQPVDRHLWRAYEASRQQAYATAAVLHPHAEIHWHATRWELLPRQGGTSP